MRQTLEAAQQQELQYKSQMEVFAFQYFGYWTKQQCCFIVCALYFCLFIDLDTKSSDEHTTNAAAFGTSTNARKHIKITAWSMLNMFFML